jgi:propanol-preferring alcohol dehydrogenase
VALGPNVDIVKEGDVVGVPWLYEACGHCNYCTTGWESLCLKQVGTGYVVDGGHAEYMIANARYVAHFPSGGFDFYEMAPILCAGVTVYKGLKMTDVHVGQWVAISGVGGLGHLAIQYAKAMGLRVAAIDISEDKLELAKKVGADIVLNASKVDTPTFLQKEVGGLDGLLVTASSVSAFEQGFHALKRGGTMTCVGIATGSMSFPVLDTVVKAITIRGSVVGNRWDVQEAIDLAIRGKVKTEITKAKLEDINQIFDRFKRGEVIGRTVLEISAPV